MPQYLVRRNVMMEQTLMVTAESKKAVREILTKGNASGEVEGEFVQVCELECLRTYPPKSIKEIRRWL